MELVFLEGFATSAGLIVAIGAQNAFVLRQGLKREHVFAVASVCALSDMLLIALGLGGMGTLVQHSPAALAAARWGGALFLLAYGIAAARRAWRGGGMAPGEAPTLSLGAALSACLAFTYLNPHCWLDTVVLLGAIGGQQPPALRGWFGAGAASASLVWFFSLGYGARLLAPLFARRSAWRALDGAIALVMVALAASLVQVPGLSA